MNKGTRITVNVYGQDKTGTITRLGPSQSIVFVQLDGSKHERWFHRSSVNPIAA